MSNTSHSIEITIDHKTDEDRYLATVLSHKKHLMTVATQQRFDDVEAMLEYLREAVDAWC